jgi:hypothetical protein
MCYVIFKIDIVYFEYSLTVLGVKFKINNFELHITQMNIYLYLLEKIEKNNAYFLHRKI